MHLRWSSVLPVAIPQITEVPILTGVMCPNLSERTTALLCLAALGINTNQEPRVTSALPGYASSLHLSRPPFVHLYNGMEPSSRGSYNHKRSWKKETLNTLTEQGAWKQVLFPFPSLGSLECDTVHRAPYSTHFTCQRWTWFDKRNLLGVCHCL